MDTLLRVGTEVNNKGHTVQRSPNNQHVSSLKKKFFFLKIQGAERSQNRLM